MMEMFIVCDYRFLQMQVGFCNLDHFYCTKHTYLIAKKILIENIVNQSQMEHNSNAVGS